MKSKVLSLTKVFLKNSFQTMKRQNVKKDEPKSKKIGMIILYLFLGIYLSSIMGFLSYNLVSSLMVINQEQVFLSVFFFAIAFLMVFQTVFSSINVMYFARDLECILPLPIKPRTYTYVKI